jgi:hypothetical protein
MFGYSDACLWVTDVYRATSFSKSVPWMLPEHIPQVCIAPVPKGGAILKKVSIEAIPMLYYLGKVAIKRLYRFISQKFLMMKQYKYFYAKKLNRQSECIVSNPRIFKGEAVQVLLWQKI